jgi:hypothetical protein
VTNEKEAKRATDHLRGVVECKKGWLKQGTNFKTNNIRKMMAWKELKQVTMALD